MANILSVRLHGRGGQGVVTAAELIALAGFYEGKYVQAFPNFGVERRGAPIEAYARLSDEPVRRREQIYEPDIIIVQDATLIGLVDVLKGLKPKGKVIINSNKIFELNIPEDQVFYVPVTKLAIEILGRPVANTGLLAAFAKITGLIKFESLEKAVKENFEGKDDLIKKNIALMEKINETITL